MKFFSFYLIINIVYASRYTFDYDDTSRQCKRQHKVCSFVLKITKCFGMRHPKFVVYSDKRKLYGINDTDIIKFNVDDIVTGIGAYGQKFICVNNKFPGPNLIVYQNQRIRVKFQNDLDTESFTIHFHGLLQRGTPHMDGVEHLTQHVIPPKTEFIYEFKAGETGTYFYHAHNYLFHSLFGPFIVLPKNSEVLQKQKQHVLMVNDWYSDYYPDRDIASGVSQFYLSNSPFDSNSGNLIDQIRQDAITQTYKGYSTNNHMINGKGESYNNPSAKLPLEVFKVEAGQNNRFRVINAGTEAFYVISIDKHRFKVVASDGSNLKPISNVESLLIAPGERYDLVVNANQSVGNYWIRALTMKYTCTFVDESNAKALAILRYNGAPEVDPTTERDACPGVTCKTVGCFSPYQFDDRNCYTYNDLKSLRTSPLKDFKHPPSAMLNYFQMDDLGVSYAPHFGMNMFAFMHPHKVPLYNLDKNEDLLSECDQKCVRHDFSRSLCSCYNSLELKNKQKAAYFVLTDMKRSELNFGGRHEHPMHLHGHKFEVLKVGFPTQPDPNVCKFVDNTDVSCSKNLNVTYGIDGCRKARLLKELSELSLEVGNPPLKDTISIPQFGYVIVRFPLDNPGLWAFHCHNMYHQFGGMMMVIHERVEDLKAILAVKKLNDDKMQE